MSFINYLLFLFISDFHTIITDSYVYKYKMNKEIIQETPKITLYFTNIFTQTIDFLTNKLKTFRSEFHCLWKEKTVIQKTYITIQWKPPSKQHKTIKTIWWWLKQTASKLKWNNVEKTIMIIHIQNNGIPYNFNRLKFEILFSNWWRRKEQLW